MGKLYFFLMIVLGGMGLSNNRHPIIEEDTGSLILNIKNVKTDTGIIWIGIYDSEQNFLIKEKAILERYDISSPVKNPTIRIESLKFGEYAIALFHDVNGNGEMDRNFFGIPSEPYAFSKKPKSRWRLPRFDEIKFDFKANNQSISTTLEKW